MKIFSSIALSMISIFTITAGAPNNHSVDILNESDKALTINVQMKRDGSSLLKEEIVAPKSRKTLFSNELMPNDVISITLPSGKLFSYTIQENSSKLLIFAVTQSGELIDSLWPSKSDVAKAYGLWAPPAFNSLQ